MKFSPLFLIFLLFLGLRLGGVINWSWFWVFSPIIANILIWAPLWYYQMKLEKLKKIQEALREAREKEKGTYGKRFVAGVR